MEMQSSYITRAMDYWCCIEVLINESVDVRYQHRIKIHIAVKKSWKLCQAQYTFPTEGILKRKDKDTFSKEAFFDAGSIHCIVVWAHDNRTLLVALLNVRQNQSSRFYYPYFPSTINPIIEGYPRTPDSSEGLIPRAIICYIGIDP